MVGNKINGSIAFYYDSKELFDAVGILSSYMSKNLVADSLSALDEFSISSDEWDIYKVCLKQSLPNIYDEFLKMTSCITEAFDDEVKIESEDTSGLNRKAGTYVEITIRNNNAYNSNVLSLVDSTLLTCIKYGVLAEFYSVCQHEALFRVANDKYITSLMQLRQRTLPLKRKVVSSQF